jgi:hypothetical protein
MGVKIVALVILSKKISPGAAGAYNKQSFAGLSPALEKSTHQT